MFAKRQWAVAVAVISAGGICAATVVVPLTFEKLCARAEIVFSGRVASIESRRDADAIHTYTTFDEIEWISGGEVGETTFTVRTLGGQSDGEIQTVDGMPHFQVGQRYVLFVRGNNRAACPVVGWEQGCFHVVESDGETHAETYQGQRVAAISQDRLETQSAAARSVGVRGLTLDAFVQAIRERTTPADQPATEGR